MTAPLIILSGPPGSGKTTVVRQLAEQCSRERAIHMHTDDFYRYIRKGFIPTWLPEAQAQNIVTLEAFAVSAKRFAQGGYEVFVDGIIGPWYLDPWLQVLRPDKATTIARSTERQSPGALVNPEVVSKMWDYFAHLGAYEAHAIDTTGQSVEASVATVQTALESGGFRLYT